MKYNRLLPGLSVIDATLDDVLRAEYGPAFEVLNEFLDLEGSRGAGYDEVLLPCL